MRRSLRLLLLPLFAWLAASAAAQDSVSIDARFAPATAKPGDEVVLEVELDIDPAYHVYGKKDGDPATLKVLDNGGLEAVGETEFPDGTEHTTFGQTNYWVKGKPVFRQRFRVPAGATGTVRLDGRVDYMACTEQFCDPPAKEAFTVRLAIAGAAPAAGGGDAATTPGLGLPGVGATGKKGRVAAQARFVPAQAQPGDEVVLEITGVIEPGYHVYGGRDSAPVKLALGDAGGLEAVGPLGIPPGEEHTTFGITNYWVKDRIVLTQRFKVPAGAAATVRVAGSIDYLACTETTCDPPAKAAFAAELAVVGGAAGAGTPAGTPGTATNGGGGAPPQVAPAAGAGGDPAPVRLREPRFSLDGAPAGVMGSLWALIFVCIGGGLLALAMPCTYPMIPITFSFFTKQADARGGKVLPLALAYGGGIIGMFVVIGVAIGSVVVEFATHWATNLVIGSAFVVFALSLFGFLVLQPPQFVNRIAGNAGRTGGVVGVFLMGATLVISSFTCTAPIVGSLLASVATAGRARVALGMGVFGLTMAAPFVALALLPGRVKKLPKSGEWMNTLKVSLGFVELAAALKFFSNVDASLGLGVMPREVFLMAWAFVFTLLALFLFGLFAYRSVPMEGVSKARNGFGAASLAFAFYCVYGTTGLALDPVMTAFEPPYRLHALEEHAIVTDDHAAAMELARKEQKWVLVNFTGFT